ncbi:MAG: hypothetical protein ACI4OR_03070 [Alphaproteobacteria bacterium]
MKQKYLWGLVLGVSLLTSSLQAQELLLEEVKTAEIPVFHLTYTWGDFLMGNSCSADFNQLKILPFLSEQQRFLQDKMEVYCVKKITVWDSLLIQFRQNKKALLKDKMIKENGPFLGFLKALPYDLFDIHHYQPKGDTLFAQLDRIQNAIQDKNPEQVIFLMQSLSPNDQLFLMPLFNEASRLIDFKKALAESEENDD